MSDIQDETIENNIDIKQNITSDINENDKNEEQKNIITENSDTNDTMKKNDNKYEENKNETIENNKQDESKQDEKPHEVIEKNKNDECKQDDNKLEEIKSDEKLDEIKQNEKMDENSDKIKLDEKKEENENDENKSKPSLFSSSLLMPKSGDQKLSFASAVLNVVKNDDKLKAFVDKLSKKKNIFDEIERKNRKKKIEDPKEADMAERIWKKRPPNKAIKEKDTTTCKISQIK